MIELFRVVSCLEVIRKVERKTMSGLMLTLLLTGLLTLAFSIQQVRASEPLPMEWSKTYGGPDDDSAHSLVQTVDGGYALAGSTESYGVGETDFWLVKLGTPAHELVVSITAPASITLGSSSSLNATVTNQGSGDEANVEFSLLINGTPVNSTTVSVLKAGNSYTLSHLWTPTVQAIYNVTAYARPVPGETSTENNQKTKLVTVARVGVEAGDWIKVDYTITGWSAGTPYPLWLKWSF